MSYPAVPLPPETFEGHGVYILHYRGDFAAYANLGETPIYVGQARDVYRRLTEHARSIEQVENLNLTDFECRWLILAQVWIGLTEDTLIGEYRPIWNAIRGFGNHDQGRTRNAQRRSPWDTLHPGRPWAAAQQEPPGGRDDVLAAVRQQRESQS